MVLHALSLTVLVATLAMAPSALAQANEVCVSCSGPPAVYRCTVDDADSVTRYKGGDRILQFICTTELSKAGGHQKCRTRRGSAEPCIGMERTVSLSGSIDALAEQAADGEPTESSDLEPAAPEKASGPPKTVEELARRTATASKDQLDKTGSAVGGAMKKSWNCMISLFQDC